MSQMYDVIIVGAGPGGMFAAMELIGKGLKVLMLEHGRPYAKRLECPIMDLGHERCPGSGCGGSCNVISGFGGAFTQRSGGTLSMYPAGSHLLNYFPSEKILIARYNEVLGVWKNFADGRMKLEGDIPKEKIYRFGHDVSLQGGVYKHWQGYKMSREVLNQTTQKMEEHIKNGIEVAHRKSVTKVEKQGKIWHLYCADGTEYMSKSVLFSTGRKGNSVVSQILTEAGIQYARSSIDIGIRLEIDEGIIDHLAEIHPDVKIKFDVHGHEVRTFCFCPGGRMAVFSQDPVDEISWQRMLFLEGYIGLAESSGRTNMSFLHRLSFENSEQVWDFQRKFEGNYQKMGGVPIAQRYTDLGKPVFRALPDGHTLSVYRIGGVMNVIPNDSGEKILEAMRRFNRLMGGKVLTDRAVLIAPELGNFWPEVVVNNDFQTSRAGMFMAGDGLGFTRGALQASLTGTAAARGIQNYLSA